MLNSDKTTLRDPIRDTPLRDPGESLREEIDTLFSETVMPWLAIAVLAVIFAITECVRWSIGASFQPVAISVVAVGVVAVAAWKMNQARRTVQQLKLGLKGERAVGQFLQSELLPRNCFVIHDVCVGDANIDHAVIGPRGIFSIEVKTQSKPRRGEARISYDGQRILVNGCSPDRNPLHQALAQAKNLREILENQTGKKVSVRPVVLYPEWFVEEPAGVDVWVLNEKRFLGYIEHEPVRFTDEQVRELANGLMRHVRAQLPT